MVETAPGPSFPLSALDRSMGGYAARMKVALLAGGTGGTKLAGSSGGPTRRTGAP